MNYKKMTKAELINELESLKSRLEAAGVSGKSKDTTDRKQAEKIIREQSRLLDLIFKNSLDSIVLLDKDYNFIRVSETYAKACQRDSSEFPGHNHFEFYPSNFKDEVDEAKKGKYVYQKSARPFIFPDHPEWGTTYWDLGLVPILDKEGEIELFLFTLKDVTERKKAEETLKKSEEKYRRLMETAKDAILCDINGTITDWNKSAEELFGYSKDEIMGKSVSVLVPEKYKKEHQEGLERFLKTGESRMIGKTMEVSGITKEGAEIPIEISLTAQKIEEEKYSFMAIARDITERKQSEGLLREKEQQMRLVMLSTNDSIWNWNMVAGTVERSIGFERAFGYAVDDIDSGIEWWADRLHPDDKERVLQTFNDAVAGGKAFCGYEYRFRCRDGSYANIEDSVCIIREDTGKVVRSLGAMRNITERKKAEELLHKQKKVLEQKNIALSEILGQIEIEKKQIKDNVIANAENLLLPIIQKLRLTGESRKYVQLLRKNIQELTSSFGRKLTEKETKLTSREIEICDMIKKGLTNKEIARLLNISLATIERHRANIRKKLGIIKKDINLSSFLKTL